MWMYYVIGVVAAILYGFATVSVMKQGGKYSVERGSSYKKGMIFPAIVMAIPPIAIIVMQLL
ncbi:hypothetical protein [Wohlfahrtiimonas larvae]|uniref:Uncharacterized protein n=1 Tax=Wohlfahrtiimonas larvae TaxID=1157986 RepID=A0ABP9MPN3_9GAMM|nr:hypothetical protein [Wohlfahrtiimonas larvae]